MPREVGPCRAFIPRFYFNETLNECVRFVYGGCGGNENNFETQQECEKKCRNNYNRKNDPCLTLQQKRNFCAGGKKLTAAVWYFDTKSKLCWRSKYEKCGKNLTMFPSCSNCVATCQAHMEAIQVCEKEKLPK
uniref:Pancreatic trypsin inhibitor n=1 Tax=Rhipicephalus zambeziensis TaxID=60191 RepID=A0A224Y504_9ACAR